MDVHWQHKKARSDGMSNPQINDGTTARSRTAPWAESSSAPAAAAS